MRVLTAIIGNATDQGVSERLHALSHAGRVEYLVLEREDTLRRRLRGTTDAGTDCAVALSREQQLEDGSVLSLSDESAIVVRMSEERWLRVKPRDSAAAVELGYFAGNLHWRVRFVGDILMVAVEGPRNFYLERLRPFLDDGRAEVGADE